MGDYEDGQVVVFLQVQQQCMYFFVDVWIEGIEGFIQ